LLLKSLHTTCVLLSLCGFLLRTYWMLMGDAMLQNKAVKIVPHVIDTLLLLSALGLLAVLGFGLLAQSWLIHKIGLLVVYIVLGMIALGNKYKRPVRIAPAIGALLVFLYMLGIAISKSPLSWLFYLFF